MIVKGNLVPARNPEGGILLVTEAPSPDVFLAYLSNLRRFLEESMKLSGLGEAPQEERLEFIADMIALFFKAPLLREPVEGLHLSPFKAYLSYRILRKTLPTLTTMREVLKILFDRDVEDQLASLFSILNEAAKGSEVVLTGYPADTRPGYNLSSLMIHWMAVSALAWSRGYRLGLGRREMARLRIASLLHDVGKPLEPRRHVIKGVEVIKVLLRGLIDEEDMKAIIEIVRSHHAREYKGPYEKEVQAIKEADHFSSGIDRLGSVVKEVIVKELSSITGMSEEETFNRFYSPGSWDAWDELESSRPGTLRKLTERCVKSLIFREVKVEDISPKTFPETFLLKLDVASIQSFIRESEKLPLLAASSYIVDLAVMFNSLRSVQETLSTGKYGVWYPVEGFLYSAGGNILAIVPKGLVEGVTEVLKSSFRRKGKLSLGFGPLGVRIAVTELKSNYGEIIEELDRKLLREKISLMEPLEPGEDPYEKSSVEGLTGIERTCDYCGKRPAVYPPIRMGEEIFYVCEECRGKYELFEKGNVRSKWRRAVTTSGIRVEEAFGLGWNEGDEGERVRDVLIEIIAGHDAPKEIKEGRLLNVAVLKVDGNLMGAFMARSISFSDALERSARIDLALKKSFKTALRSIYEGLKAFDGRSDREEARLLIGLQYMGGDDALLFSPSWASIPLAIVLMVEFAREMGFSYWEDRCAHTGATLSIGLAAAPARHNIWALLDAAEELLDRAKEVGRYPVFMGAMAFDVTEGGLLTGKAVATRERVLASLRLTVQPWVIGPLGRADCDPLWTLRKNSDQIRKTKPILGKRPDIVEFLSSLMRVTAGGRKPWFATNEDLKRFYAEIFKSIYREYLAEKSGGMGEKLEKEGSEANLRRLRNVARELEVLPGRFDVSPGEIGYESMIRLFAASKARERDERSKALYKVITTTFTPEGAALEDVNRLCKIMLGGAR